MADIDPYGSNYHAIRMLDYMLPRYLFYAEFIEGKFSQEGQSKRFKDVVQLIVNNLSITNCWEETANYRVWRNAVKRSKNLFQRNSRLRRSPGRQVYSYQRNCFYSQPTTQVSRRRKGLIIRDAQQR